MKLMKNAHNYMSLFRINKLLTHAMLCLHPSFGEISMKNNRWLSYYLFRGMSNFFLLLSLRSVIILMIYLSWCFCHHLFSQYVYSCFSFIFYISRYICTLSPFFSDPIIHLMDSVTARAFIPILLCSYLIFFISRGEIKTRHIYPEAL